MVDTFAWKSVVRTALLYFHVKTTEKNMEYYENIEHDVSHTSQDEGKHVFKFFRHKVELNCLQLP